jgi:glutathione S-transferase
MAIGCRHAQIRPMRYELYYWPMIQGRGEYIRLALEEAGADYIDAAREPDGMAAMQRLLDGETTPRPSFAPPFLKAGRLLIGQTATILLYLGDQHGLAPSSLAGRLWVHQLQLTIADLVAEIHDTHHPIASALYYQEQKDAAKRRSQDFIANRLPKFFHYFETILTANKNERHFLAGAKPSYADLSLFQVKTGLDYAFPRAMSQAMPNYPRITALAEHVAARPRVAAYLASDRRIPFNEDGIFRHYDELDAAS